jgi:ABC-type phosphate transport system substrate-binding protein
MRTSVRHTKLRAAAITLALAAAVTAGGVALAAPAGAAELGKVVVEAQGAKGSNPYWDTWNATWGKAWDECRRVYPRTKSVDLVSYDYWDTGNTRNYAGQWSCRDTP